MTPNCCCRLLESGRLFVLMVNGAAFKAGLRWYQYTSPSYPFFPDFVVILITPPPVCPNSAEKLDVCTVNSCTVSGEMVTIARPRPTPVLLAPSARIDVLPA